jgi:hypothetical protein
MSSIKRPDGQWRARYRDSSGREHARHFGRRVDASRWLDEVTASVVTGAYVDPRAGRMTFREYAEGWRAGQVHRPSSAAHVETMLRRHAYPTLGESRSPRSGRAKSRHGPKASPPPWLRQRSRSCTGIVAAVFKAAIRDHKVMGSPCDGTKLPKSAPREVEPLATSTVDGLLEALPGRYGALALVAAGTGLRQGECLGLTVDRSGLQPPSVRPALKVDRQLVLVQGAAPFLGPPKTTASYRSVPRVVVEALSGHLAGFPAVAQEILCRDTGAKTWQETVALVFTDDHGQPLRRTAFSPIWRRARGPGGQRAEGRDVSRSEALLRIPADPPRRERQGRAEAARARHGRGDARHLLAPVARLRRPDPRGD